MTTETRSTWSSVEKFVKDIRWPIGKPHPPKQEFCIALESASQRKEHSRQAERNLVPAIGIPK